MTDNEGDDRRPPESSRVYIWDVPTRLFHWLLAGAVATSLAAGEFGNMDVHVISGHVVLALLLFRLVWGVVGGRHARFADFVRGPVAVFAYLRRMARGGDTEYKGHNPLGGWSVMALLLVLCFQVGSGLFANDDILTEGPLADTIDKSLSDTLTYWHEQSGTVLYVLIGLHLFAIMFYAAKGHELLEAMITGSRTGRGLGATVPGARGNPLIAAVLAALAAAAAYAVMNY